MSEGAKAHSVKPEGSASTLRGEERYQAGVLEYKKMGYWEPDYEPKETDLNGAHKDRP